MGGGRGIRHMSAEGLGNHERFARIIMLFRRLEPCMQASNAMACVDGSDEIWITPHEAVSGILDAPANTFNEFYESVSALHSSEVCASQVGKPFDVSLIA